MSVAQLSAQEFGTFAAICAHLELAELSELCELCEVAATGNRKAYEHSYNDFIEPITSEEIEQEARRALADHCSMVSQHFGPLAYNMISQDGTTYDDSGEIDQESEIIERLRKLENAAKKWQETEERKKRREEQDAKAFEHIGPLKKLSQDEIVKKCEAAGCSRVIYADFMVDQSDSMTDYHGGRCARRVVIGFGKGKRENFKQLRKAAGAFPPTESMGPGKDIYTPEVVFSDQVHQPGGRWYSKGQISPWHSEIQNHITPETFTTEAEAREFIDSKSEPGPVNLGDGITAHFEWTVKKSSIEQRENYSMGGGNYLGTWRYSGWKVSSWGLDYFTGDEEIEYFEPSRSSRKPKRAAKRKAADSSCPPSSVCDQTTTGDGYPCHVEKHFHTKRRFDFWLVVLDERVEHAEHIQLRHQCENSGGWYSRKWGDTPGGFAFEDETDAARFAEDIGGGNNPGSRPVPVLNLYPNFAGDSRNGRN